MNDKNKAYSPHEVEEKWYSFWQQNHFFKADNLSKKKSYCIVLPPPNVTGSLHMGHALVDAIQDILIRTKRMQGYETLWVPGTDHAGISTQTVVEKHLIKQTGKRRKDFEREEFLAHIWKWKADKENRILTQLKKLGCSCDWSRLRFTMDEKNNKAVRHVFKKMYDDGLIYQGDYLVNWDPVTQTALADDEVEYEEKASSLWYFRYPVENHNEYIVIATTRPETMLGDTAVAVNPKDLRYTHLIGKKILLPLTDRKIPIIADPFVDIEFGTGAVKITPAHDVNDYEMALRHNLAMINIMTPEGSINEEAPAFEGLSMFDARQAVVKEMKKLDLIEKIEPYTLRVGVSYRSKAVIEPYLSKQWFVNMNQFKPKLLQLVKEDKVALIPKHWKEVYFHWIENLRDWCISRQLWWGHRIPIWYNKEDPSKIICYDGDDEPLEVQKNPSAWQQDEDVLDTWFSSALWPFSTLGWPEKSADLSKFFPTSVLVTGHDILFFWVARMILMSEYVLKNVPFHQAFMHGLIYGKSYWREDNGTVHYVPHEEKLSYDMGKPIPADVFSKWEKMSKSKGNVIDPLEIIESFGTDALRFALCSSITFARQIDLDRRKFEEFKNFSNKIWNAARFVLSHVNSEEMPSLTKERLEKGLDFSQLQLEDRWILSKLNQVIKETLENLENYAFDKLAMRIYHFFWNDFCSNYLELIKPSLFGKMGSQELRETRQILLVVLLDHIVRLLHPIAPFITEEIFSKLKELFSDLNSSACDKYTASTIHALQKKACIVAPYPKIVEPKHIDEMIEKQFGFLEKIVYSIRNMRSELNIPLGMKTEVFILVPSKEKAALESNISFIYALTKTSNIHLIDQESKFPALGSLALVEKTKIMIPLPNELLDQEKSRLSKEKEKLLKSLEQTKQKLDNQEFISKAPKKVIENFKSTYEKSTHQLKEIEEKLKKLS